jgi:serine/threonine-protein kinase
MAPARRQRQWGVSQAPIFVLSSRDGGSSVSGQDAAALRIVEACLEIEDEAARDAEITARAAGDNDLAERARRLLARSSQSFRLLATENFGATAARLAIPVPERIGPFRVTGRIGDGGMGTVVRAEREDGVYDQTVAIKLIRADIADRSTRERFDAERRILATLDHPGIARVVDGGEIDGRPWLAMEYVDGQPVTLALDQAAAGLDARLDAFLAVCTAVSFAHRNLVIHADIKPANALMRTDGAIKLLDFGIARLMVDLESDETATPYPLTRDYAAPERAGGVAPTVVGDVYSLGVLLHELLTGTLPDGIPEATGKLDGDLAAIIARALAADPAARYPDVAALVADIEAYRGHLPVAARSDAGAGYRSAKFIRRHRTGVIATGLVVALLAAAALIATALYIRAERARGEAEARFGEVRALAHFMLFDLYDRLAASPGTVESRIRLADTARRYLDQLRAVPEAPADLRLESAMGYRRLAMVQGVSGVSSLGRIDQARHSLDVAQSVLDSLLRDDPRNAAALAERGWVDANRWTVEADTKDSIAINRSAAGWFDRALAIEPGSIGARIGRLITEKNRGYDLIWTRDRPKEAVPVLARALTSLRALAVPATWRDEAKRLEITLLNLLGDARYYGGDHATALGYYREAEAVGAAELRKGETPARLTTYGQAAWNYGSMLDGRTAVAKVRQGRRAIERALTYGPDASAEKLLLILLGEEANQLMSLGDAQAALAPSARSIALRETRLISAPDNPTRLRDLAIALPAHSDILAAAGQPNASCAAARRAVTILDALKATGRLGARDIGFDIPKALKAVATHCP